jgi:hypothetical protein
MIANDNDILFGPGGAPLEPALIHFVPADVYVPAQNPPKIKMIDRH